MIYNKLISQNNLELAWRRIVTGRNLQYKKIYRPIYLAYEIAYRENINHLHQRLKGAWRPTTPDRIFFPKPTGLQRPLTLLSIEDQIVLQSVANIYANKLFERRKKVECSQVFSNLLSDLKDSKFFLQDWHISYSTFQQKCIDYFYEGFKWIAYFDLAAFYDTLSHSTLIRLISPRGGDQDTWSLVKSWFRVWSSIGNSSYIEHGIPQGPLASDFFAECFLLPLDEIMMKENVGYVRYVDDIRIFGRTRNEAQDSVLKMEEVCRNMGLIPQGGKFKIREAKSPEQMLDIMPSLPPPYEFPDGSERQQMTSSEAEKKFSESLSGRPLEIIDKSMARFVLFRAPKSKKLLRQVLALIPRHPEQIDSFVVYLSNYSKSKVIERKLHVILLGGMPYEYVRGELWQILARIGSLEVLSLLLPYTKKELKNRHVSMILRWGIYAFLLECQRQRLGKFSSMLKNQPTVVKALLIPILPEEIFTDKHNNLLSYILKSKDFESGIMLAEQFLKRNLTHRDFGIRISELPIQTQNVFRRLGIIARRSRTNVDQISDILVSRYGIPNTKKWRVVFGQEYVHALQILIQADELYEAGRSNWLSHQNSFNDALLRAFIAYLKESGLPGVIRLKDKMGRNIKFGSLLDKNNRFSIKYKRIADSLRETNKRRNTLPGSHPYDEKGGSQNKFLSPTEQLKLKFKLSLAYETIIRFVNTNS